jgi:NADH:ubiquinone oxidoreductase subunit K
MPEATIVRIVCAVLFVIGLAFLIQRRRTRVK